MDPLFSELPAETVTPVVQRTAEVEVPVSQQEAFLAFTEYVHLWWPTDQLVYPEDSYVSFDQEYLVESDAHEAETIWARIEQFNEPHSIVLGWILHRDPEDPSRVSISFEPVSEPNSTRVSLEYETWAGTDAGSSQPEPGQDWSQILHSFGHFMGAATGQENN